VRHTADTGKWAPWEDALAGTMTYGIPHDRLANRSWTVPWGPGVSQFLFAFGDCSKWLIADASEVTREPLTDAPRRIIKSSSSETPYAARWYNHGEQDDLSGAAWISVHDRDECVDARGACVLYSEGFLENFKAKNYHGGTDVYVRQVADEAATPFNVSKVFKRLQQKFQVSATGDPHLQNIHSERFDLMQPGRHTLLLIPRGAGPASALLRVEAVAERMGPQCGEMYFQSLNMTGTWAEARQRGGLLFLAAELDLDTPKWMRLGRVDLKVVNAATRLGVPYLNIYVRNLAHAGFPVGGLLGEDDHTRAAARPADCGQIELMAEEEQEPGDESARVGSLAEASL
jgi:hypothetical protein